MANEQPAPTAAPEPVAPQAPAPEPAQQPAAQPSAEPTPTQATNLFDSLDEGDKAYLKSQGIEDLSKPENVEKLVKHNLSLKKTSSETAAELARIKSSVTGVPAEQPAGEAPTNAPSQSTTEIDQVTAFNLATGLATQFPSLKEDLVSGQFYKDFAASGRALKDESGQLNLPAILAYGKEQQDYRDLKAKLEELEKPNPNAIPSATPSTPAQPADDAPMTKQMAQAILFQDPNHVRAKEAQQFLQSQVK